MSSARLAAEAQERSTLAAKTDSAGVADGGALAPSTAGNTEAVVGADAGVSKRKKK